MALPIMKVNKFGRGGLIATVLAGSLLTEVPSFAKDVGAAAGRRISISSSEDILSKYNKLQDILDTTLAITDKNSSSLKTTKDLLYRTAIHESGQLNYVSQLGGGPARSIFQIEPDTAVDVVQRWAAKKANVLSALEETSGLSRGELLGMSKGRLGELLKENQLFAASVARYRYKMDPGAIPEGLNEQAEYWQKVYQRGGEKVRQARIKSFTESNQMFAKKLSNVMLNQQKIGSKAGTASSKAVKFLRKILPR